MSDKIEVDLTVKSGKISGFFFLKQYFRLFFVLQSITHHYHDFLKILFGNFVNSIIEVMNYVLRKDLLSLFVSNCECKVLLEQAFNFFSKEKPNTSSVGWFLLDFTSIFFYISISLHPDFSHNCPPNYSCKHNKNIFFVFYWDGLYISTFSSQFSIMTISSKTVNTQLFIHLIFIFQFFPLLKKI